MNLPGLTLTAIGLSMDCFAVSITIASTHTLQWRQVLRMALFFGLFQGAMPLTGWLVGNSLQAYIASVDHWIAFSILSFIGLRMIWHAWKNHSSEGMLDIGNLTVLLSLSVATSMDALITGIGFGFINVNILEAVILITLVTFLVSVAGAKLAMVTRIIPARLAEIAGGIVLIGMGVSILAEHLKF